jgi:NAD(P)-dependent dehydrogenase (short-subunit alcohol dehydrogenase family)
VSKLRFDGRSAIITGAGRGLGRTHALLLASRGARVLVADSGAAVDGDGGSKAPADEVVAEIKAKGGEAVACYASVAEPAGGAAIVEAALDSFGRLDIVINNAGISDPTLFEDLSLDRFRRAVDILYLGSVQVLKAAWPRLLQAGYGRVVNTVSEGMFGAHQMATDTGSANGGAYALTMTLATEGLRHGVHVNAISPRAATRMTDPQVISRVLGVPEEMLRSGTAALTPELVSPAVAFLAHESCKLNGEVLVAGGGQVLSLAAFMTKGIHNPALTPEDVAEQIDAVLNVDGAQRLVVQAAPSS